MLVTTHYMDEAERCHRLAFIFRGEVLAVGTPARGGRARASCAWSRWRSKRRREAAEVLREHAVVDEVTLLGDVLRVAMRGCADPSELRAQRSSRSARHRASASCTQARANVEDAFVSMVRAERSTACAATGGSS